MADFAYVTPEGWEQGDDADTESYVTPETWEQHEGSAAASIAPAAHYYRQLMGR